MGWLTHKDEIHANPNNLFTLMLLFKHRRPIRFPSSYQHRTSVDDHSLHVNKLKDYSKMLPSPWHVRVSGERWGVRWSGWGFARLYAKTDFTLKGEKGMCFLIFPYTVTCMWAYLVGCAACNGGVVNVWRRQRHLAALHHALTHSGLYFHEPCGLAHIAVKYTLPSAEGKFTFGIFVTSLTWHTWIQDGIRENPLPYIIGEHVRGCDNHGQSHSLLSSCLWADEKKNECFLLQQAKCTVKQ